MIRKKGGTGFPSGQTRSVCPEIKRIVPFRLMRVSASTIFNLVDTCFNVGVHDDFSRVKMRYQDGKAFNVRVDL